jgi:Na+-transporting methylmalonyl-CoA/oxaloacetate decarboxylase gamma subunit
MLVIIISATTLQGRYGDRISYRYTPETTLAEVSTQTGIPVVNLINYLELPADTDRTKTLSELGVTGERIEEARSHFSDKVWGFSWNIVLVGMIVIFVSLSLTGFFINLLSRIVKLSERERTKAATKKKKSGEQETKRVKIKDIKSRDTGYNAIVAAITALHFHLQEAEELSKMTLAWKREPVSVWKTSGKFDMPNRVIREKKE